MPKLKGGKIQEKSEDGVRIGGYDSSCDDFIYENLNINRKPKEVEIDCGEGENLEKELASLLKGKSELLKKSSRDSHAKKPKQSAMRDGNDCEEDMGMDSNKSGQF